MCIFQSASPVLYLEGKNTSAKDTPVHPQL